MNLKNILKSLKLNESAISMVLGAVVIIVVGVLVVNYFRKSDTGTILPPVETVQEEESQPQPVPEKGGVYIVKAGDTLWSIAEETYGSGYNWSDIAQANSISSPGLIEDGQELILPNVESRLGDSLFTVTEDENGVLRSAKGGIKTSYTVVKGDSLWSIAIRTYGDGYRWTDIAEENNLTNPNLIHPGNVFRLPQ